ncbi:MAG: MarR family transcriptional regulator [Rhizobiales bacterium]|nr:MarR family transcriptional regulator [Hyphomicrobiales bacterium]
MSVISSPRPRFGMQFVLTARRWRAALDEKLAAVGLSDASWAPLMHLAISGDGVSQKELAARMGLDGSSLVRLIDLLETRGLVARRTDEADRRARHIDLTSAGHAAVAFIRERLDAAEAEMLADLSDTEIEQLIDAFARINARLEAGRPDAAP